ATRLAEVKTQESLRSLAQSRAGELAARSRAADTPNTAIALAMHSLSAMNEYGVITGQSQQALRGAVAQTRGERVFCQPQVQKHYFDTTSSFAVSPAAGIVAVGTRAGSLCVYRQAPDQAMTLVDALQSFGGDTIAKLQFSPKGDWLFTYTRSRDL